MASKIDPYLIDDDNPVLTESEAAELRPAAEVFAELGITPPKPRGRPKGGGTKVTVNMSFDKDLVSALRATGKGWQTRVNDLLRREIM